MAERPTTSGNGNAGISARLSAKHERKTMQHKRNPKVVIRHHSRGYLPHLESPDLIQFITFRLADSLPADFIQTQEKKLRSKLITESEYHYAINLKLDTGTGGSFLRDPEIAKLVCEAILYFNGEKFDLHNWVVMPNHAHLLVKTIGDHTLSETMHSIKSFSASAANKLLGRKGRFWAPDYFDRFIRGRTHFMNVMRYIDENPVKARLCDSPDNYPWGQAGWKG